MSEDLMAAEGIVDKNLIKLYSMILKQKCKVVNSRNFSGAFYVYLQSPTITQRNHYTAGKHNGERTKTDMGVVLKSKDWLQDILDSGYNV